MSNRDSPRDDGFLPGAIHAVCPEPEIRTLDDVAEKHLGEPDLSGVRTALGIAFPRQWVGCLDDAAPLVARELLALGWIAPRKR
ncbi:MAG: hypothetical protein V1755_05645 [Chloroflexota bacterium]